MGAGAGFATGRDAACAAARCRYPPRSGHGASAAAQGTRRPCIGFRAGRTLLAGFLGTLAAARLCLFLQAHLSVRTGQQAAWSDGCCGRWCGAGGVCSTAPKWRFRRLAWCTHRRLRHGAAPAACRLSWFPRAESWRDQHAPPEPARHNTMVARTAFVQLHESWRMLLGVSALMALAYIVPVAVAIGCAGLARGLG